MVLHSGILLLDFASSFSSFGIFKSTVLSHFFALLPPLTSRLFFYTPFSGGLSQPEYSVKLAYSSLICCDSVSDRRTSSDLPCDWYYSAVVLSFRSSRRCSQLIASSYASFLVKRRVVAGKQLPNLERRGEVGGLTWNYLYAMEMLIGE